MYSAEYDKQVAEVIASLEFRTYAELGLQDQIYANILRNRMRGALETCTHKNLRRALTEVNDVRMHKWFFSTDASVVARALRLAYNDIRTH